MIDRQLIDLENFDPYSDDDLEPPSAERREAYWKRRLAELREELRTTTEPARILELEHHIYDLRLELTHLKHMCELLDSIKQARPA